MQLFFSVISLSLGLLIYFHFLSGKLLLLSFIYEHREKKTVRIIIAKRACGIRVILLKSKSFSVEIIAMQSHVYLCYILLTF